MAHTDKWPDLGVETQKPDGLPSGGRQSFNPAQCGVAGPRWGTTYAVQSCCMSTTIRTQIYLTDGQRELIDQVAKAEGVTMAEVVRRALDAYLSQELDPSAAVKATFGAAPEASMPSRDEWDRG